MSAIITLGFADIHQALSFMTYCDGYVTCLDVKQYFLTSWAALIKVALHGRFLLQLCVRLNGETYIRFHNY